MHMHKRSCTRIPQGARGSPGRCHSHLSLDVVLQQVVVHRIQVITAHVVIVVSHCAVEFLTTGSILSIKAFIAVVVVIMT